MSISPRSRWTLAVLAFLAVNAAGWWWVKSSLVAAVREPNAREEADGQQPGDAEPGRPNENSDDLCDDASDNDESVPDAFPAIKLETVSQSELSKDRRMTLLFRFNGPVDWRAFESSMTLSAGGKTIPWHFSGRPDTRSAQVVTDESVLSDRVTANLVAPKTPGAGLWNIAYAETLAVVPEFRLLEIDSETKSFGDPEFSCLFTRHPKLDGIERNITIEPEVPFTVMPDSWGYSVKLTGPFVPGQSYKVTFHKGVLSNTDMPLEKDSWRTVTVRQHDPAVSVAVEGRYLAPEGKLSVPVLTMNISALTCTVSRVLPQNILQLSMREANRYDNWNVYNRKTEGLQAESLTEEGVVRGYKMDVAKNVEGRQLVNLADFLKPGRRGVYLMTAEGVDFSQGSTYDSRLVCVTDLGISLRKSPEAVTVWVTRLREGVAAAGREVTLYAENNSVICKAVTDAGGLASLPFGDEEKAKPFMIVASEKDGSDNVFLPITDRTSVEAPVKAARGYLDPRHYEAFLMCDRDLYRPGEKVFVQALVRTWEGKAPAPFPVSLEVLKPNGQEFTHFAMLLDGRGCVTNTVSLPEYLPMGNYTLNLTLPGKGNCENLGSCRIHVEDFVPPQTRLAVKGVPDSLNSGAETQISLFAEHLFGKPAEGLASDLVLVYKSADFTPAAWKEYLFGDCEKDGVMKAEEYGWGETDAAGLAKYDVVLNTSLQPSMRLDVAFQGRVVELSGRSVAARAVVPYHIYPFYIGLKTPESAFVPAGGMAQVQVAVVRPDEKREASAHKLAAKLESIVWTCALRKSSEGRYTWETTRVKSKVASAFVRTSAGADVPVAFKVPTAGEYLLTVSDPESHTSTSWSFQSGDNGQSAVAWDHSKPNSVALTFDKPFYVPGDMAKMQIRSPFSGTAWVALQRERVLDSRVLTLTNNTAEVEWKVIDAFAPNVEIAVTVVRPAKAESIWSAHRASGIAPMFVRPPTRFLAVKVEPGASPAAPKRELPVRVTVAGSDGKPAKNAAVTVMAVDEGICMLTSYKTPDPNTLFLEPRTGAISFFDIYRQLMPITDERLFGAASHIGGGDGDDLMMRLNPVAARRFKPVSLWSGNVALDANGQVTIPVAVPEFAGELRVMAVAWNENASGSSDSAVKVRRPVVIQPDLPRVLAPSDKTVATIALHNESGKPADVAFTFEATGALVCAEKERKVHLDTGKSSVISVPVLAATTAGNSSLRILATGCGDVPYDEAIELAVRPAIAAEVSFDSAVIPAGGEKLFALPAADQTLVGSCRQSFTCIAPGAFNLVGALDYMVEYPYGCTEQTISSVLPAMMLDARQQKDWLAMSSAAEEVNGWVRAAIAKLRSRSRWNGYSMWGGGQSSDFGVSAYAGLFFGCAVKQGLYGISNDDVNDIASQLVNAFNSTDDVNIRAYLCHDFALLGKADQGRMAYLTERKGALSDEGRFHLARAWILAGSVDDAKDVLASMSKEPRDVPAAAFGLIVWLELDPKAPIVEKCKAELLAKFQKGFGHWGNTQLNALSVLALSAYDRHFPRKEAKPFSARIVWEGGKAECAATNSWKWTADDAVRNKALILKNAGPGEMLVTRRLSSVPQIVTKPAENHGLTVTRQWFSPKGTELAPSAIKRGDEVIVCVTVTPEGNAVLSDIVVEDLLPACMEIERCDLSELRTFDWIENGEAKWVLHHEARDDRLLLFSKNFSGAVKYHYAVRVVSSGTFTIPPITASGMYDPGRFSRGEFSTFTVSEK